MQPILGMTSLIFIVSMLAGAPASAQTDPRPQPRAEVSTTLKQLIPGEEFLPAALRAEQADDFDNPAFPFVQAGEASWSRVEGTAGKSCQNCHGEGEKNSVRHAAASYPKYQPALKQVITLQTRINICRQSALGAPALPDDSEQMIAMSAYLRWLARGVPLAADVSGPASAVFERGSELYYSKIGLLQLSCAQCHNQKFGQKFGPDVLSQGHTLSYPVFSLGERRMITLHERMRMCNQLARAEPQPVNAPDYVALELYLSWRSKQLPITAPGVRP